MKFIFLVSFALHLAAAESLLPERFWSMLYKSTTVKHAWERAASTGNAEDLETVFQYYPQNDIVKLLDAYPGDFWPKVTKEYVTQEKLAMLRQPIFADKFMKNQNSNANKQFALKQLEIFEDNTFQQRWSEHFNAILFGKVDVKVVAAWFEKVAQLYVVARRDDRNAELVVLYETFMELCSWSLLKANLAENQKLADKIRQDLGNGKSGIEISERDQVILSHMEQGHQRLKMQFPEDSRDMFIRALDDKSWKEAFFSFPRDQYLTVNIVLLITDKAFQSFGITSFRDNQINQIDKFVNQMNGMNTDVAALCSQMFSSDAFVTILPDILETHAGLTAQLSILLTRLTKFGMIQVDLIRAIVTGTKSERAKKFQLNSSIVNPSQTLRDLAVKYFTTVAAKEFGIEPRLQSQDYYYEYVIYRALAVKSIVSNLDNVVNARALTSIDLTIGMSEAMNVLKLVSLDEIVKFLIISKQKKMELNVSSRLDLHLIRELIKKGAILETPVETFEYVIKQRLFQLFHLLRSTQRLSKADEQRFVREIAYQAPWTYRAGSRNSWTRAILNKLRPIAWWKEKH